MSPTEFPSYNTAVTEELQWLIIYAENLSSELFSQNIYPPGWVAHHTLQKRGIQTPPGINTNLPLLRDKVSTFNMQTHLLQLNMKRTAVLNPVQTPVMSVIDLYTLLPKNSSFATQECFLNIFQSLDNFLLSNLY